MCEVLAFKKNRIVKLLQYCGEGEEKNMTSFYTEEELQKIGFKKIGKKCQISRKASIYGAGNMEIGDHVRIDDFSILSGQIRIGSYVHLAAYSAFFGGDKGIFISDYAGLSSRVTVYASTDDYLGEAMTNPTIPSEYKKEYSAPVYIGEHVLVGSTSVILPGVNLKEGSSFGSMTLINHDSEEWSVNVGIPFKKIKDRSKKILELEKEFRKKYRS